ncbi:MAG: hypothetical protein ACLVI9_01540 [Anaerostipes hadrus]
MPRMSSEFNANNTKGTGAYVVTTFVANRAGFDRSGNPDNECGNGWGYYDLDYIMRTLS